MERYGYDILLGVMTLIVALFLGEVLKVMVNAMGRLFYYTPNPLISEMAFWTPVLLVFLAFLRRALRGLKRPATKPSMGSDEKGGDIWKGPPGDEYRVW